MTDNWATREDVRVSVREILDHLDKRLEERNRLQDARHHDSIKRMDAILEQAMETNGRVTTLEEVTRNLKEEFQAIRKRWHDFRESIQKSLGSAARVAVSSEERSITRKELGWVFALIAACFSLGWIAHQLFDKGTP